jgi:hypothetical protein
MELSAILLARAGALIELAALDPKRTLSPAEISKALFEKYSFTQLPKLDSIDLQKGIQFSHGIFENISILDLTLFANGIVVDSGASTDDSEKVLLDFLGSVHKTLGANIKLHRRIFLSQVTFRSGLNLKSMHPVLQRIADRVTAGVSRDLDQSFSYHPTAVHLNIDSTQNKLTPGAFIIERRAEIPFSEQTYFSSAPLRTPEHLELIEQFESDLVT